MKRLAIIFTILLFSCTSYSQVVNDSLVTNDSTTISNTELQKVFNAIDTLVYQDSLKTVLIRDLEFQIRNYELLSSQDSLLLNYKDRQINILNEEILLYDKRLKKTNKWYNKPWVGFVGGVATVTLSSWIVKNVVD